LTKVLPFEAAADARAAAISDWGNIAPGGRHAEFMLSALKRNKRTFK
jgi:hypothetical protein